MKQRLSSRLEAELEHLAAGLLKPHRLKSEENVCEKIGRLRQKYSRASRYYDITIETDEGKKKATAIHYERIEPKAEDPNAHPGVYCLRSNQMQWDEQKLWSTCTMLTDLEAVFRSLKSELGMRPVYHQMTHRVEGHMTDRLVELDELESARTQLFEWAATALTENERRFLLSIKQGKPDWEQLPFDDLDKWPAINGNCTTFDR